MLGTHSNPLSLGACLTYVDPGPCTTWISTPSLTLLRAMVTDVYVALSDSVRASSLMI